MAVTTYAVSTELDAVNQILSSVGQAPVTTLDLQNPEVAIVLTTLREVNRQVQAEGWHFNYEQNYTFTPDSNTKEIAFPTNVLRLDTNKEKHQDKYNPVRRDGKFYDKRNHTYEWEDAIKADVTWLFEFDDVPPAIQLYIIARAARLAANKMVGNMNVIKLITASLVGVTVRIITTTINRTTH